MALPDPLPDDPRKWDGWRAYNSTNPYERLGLSEAENPSSERIEENCRRLLVWWQKKLPLKAQPSNPLTQLLRGGLDEAPMFLSEARSLLTDPAARREIDERLRATARAGAIAELTKLLDFAIADGILSPDDESRLRERGAALTLDQSLVDELLEHRLAETGARRAAPDPASDRPGTPAAGSRDAPAEFLRMLRLTELTAEEMTDDQRDAFVTMAGNLGIDSEDAEDLIDGFLEETRAREITSIVGRRPAPAAPRAHGGGEPAGGPAALPPALTEAEERARYPTFVTALGQEMLLIPSGQFNMGSTRPGAAPNEAPVMKVHLRRFHIARYPVTNAQYERFDPAHRSRRLATATECHPVVHVSHHDAVRFCTWLSSMERRRCRLPTEAEWEYAAKGASESTYPWGEHVGTGRLANFADARTRFPWSDLGIDDGYDETAPVGSYPLGASPFGVEDMAGNVWEWCHDHFDAYKGGGERLNPTGPSQGSLKVVRGGSWRSRFSSLRTTSRAGHPPAFACNDIGFRVVIECD